MDLEKTLRMLSRELIGAFMKCASAENRELLMEMASLLQPVADRIAAEETI